MLNRVNRQTTLIFRTLNREPPKTLIFRVLAPAPRMKSLIFRVLAPGVASNAFRSARFFDEQIEKSWATEVRHASVLVPQAY